MARRRITPPTQSALNPAAANVPSVMAAVTNHLNLPATTIGKRSNPNGNGNLTNHQRKLICEFYQRSGGVMSQKDLAQWTKHEFGLKKTPAQSTISGILRRQHEFINMSSLELGIKKRRVVQHPELDNALANWVIQCAHRGITVQGDMTKEKAKHFAKMLNIPDDDQPEFSNGWLHSFQLRHNFSFRKFNSDGNACEKKRVLKFTTLDALMEEARHFELRNIFCMSEMGLLYNLDPSGITCLDPKASKRLVVVLACNADGTEKLQPLYVSHHEQPASFQQKTPEQHGIQYFYNSKAWMTGVIFSKWLQRLQFAMSTQKRRILLVLHEARSHAVAHLELPNVVIYFIPENMTTLNPMTSGLLSTLKLNYRRHHLRYVIRKAEVATTDGIVVDPTKLRFQTHLLQAFEWIRRSWMELSPSTMERSWSMTQIVADRLPMRPDLQLNQEAVALEAEITHLLLCLRLPQCMSLGEFMSAEDRMCENSIHEEYFEVVQIGEELPDDDVDENDPVVLTNTDANVISGVTQSHSNLRAATAAAEAATNAANLTLQDKLKAFRDVLQVLQTRSDSDDSALTTIRRVQDAIRHEAQENTALLPDVTGGMHSMLLPQSLSSTMSMGMNMDLRQEVNNALDMVPTTEGDFHTVL